MRFDAALYGEGIARILELDGGGNRLIPLVARGTSSEEARRILTSAPVNELFPQAAAPRGALAGLWLYFSCFEEAHQVAQDDASAEGSFWHGILHRQEPDSGNAAYWFRRVGTHPVFSSLVNETAQIIEQYPDAEFRPTVKWDPFGFILFCERAREQPGSSSEKAALEIQRTEWQLLFDYCARPKR